MLPQKTDVVDECIREGAGAGFNRPKRMNQAKGLESDSDGSSIVSFEETPEERRQRKLVKKQKLRRAKDKELRKQQTMRRKQRELDLEQHLRAIKEEQERERGARWGVIPGTGALRSGPPPREQDVPKQPYV